MTRQNRERPSRQPLAPGSSLPVSRVGSGVTLGGAPAVVGQAFAALSLILLAIPAYSQQVATHCRAEGAGGSACPAEREPLPDLTPDRWHSFSALSGGRSPPATAARFTDAERAAPALEGGTATAEERAAKPGSQFEVCERYLSAVGYSHVDYANACSGLSIKPNLRRHKSHVRPPAGADRGLSARSSLVVRSRCRRRHPDVGNEGIEGDCPGRAYT